MLFMAAIAVVRSASATATSLSSASTYSPWPLASCLRTSAPEPTSSCLMSRVRLDSTPNGLSDTSVTRYWLGENSLIAPEAPSVVEPSRPQHTTLPQNQPFIVVESWARYGL